MTRQIAVWLFLYYLGTKNSIPSNTSCKNFISLLSIFIYVLPLPQKLRMVPAIREHSWISDLSMNSDPSPCHALS